MLQEMLAVLEKLCHIDGLRRNYYLDLIRRLEIEKRLVAPNRKEYILLCISLFLKPLSQARHIEPKISSIFSEGGVDLHY
jgi:hypothetical protein